MTVNIARILAASAFFQGLPPEACRQVAGLCRLRALAKREVLFAENAVGTALFLLLDGAVRLHKTAEDGAEAVIRTVRPGELFAEVILFEQDRYPVTAAAVKPSHVLSLDRRDVLRLLDQPSFRDPFIAMLMRKQRYLAERVRTLTSGDVEQRFFLFLREQYGERTLITVDLSKKDIAAALGATPETVSRLIRKLERRRCLRWKGKTITLPEGFWRDR